MRSFLWLNILADYLDFLAVVLAAVFAEVFFGAAILLAEVLLLLFFAAAFVSALRISLINGENIPEIRPEVLAVLEKLLPFASPAK